MKTARQIPTQSLEHNGLHPVVSELLLRRGYDTPEKIESFLRADLSELSEPSVLNGMEEGAAMIREHIRKQSSIVIYGDYDCDGIGAAAILYLTLRSCGANVKVFIPTRADDGYGLNKDSLTKLISAGKVDLIVTVDCGVTAKEEVEFLRQNGVSVVITDHHEPKDELPDCIVIDPKTQTDAPELCGAGVALMLSRMLCDHWSDYLDLCAISTVADLVPLKGDNRIIVKEGLKMLSSRNIRPGLKALLRAAGHLPGEAVDSYDVAFKLAPRLNAAGRLSTATKSFRLLTETDPSLLHILAQELDAENKRRQDLCVKTIEEGRKMLADYDLAAHRIIVLHHPDWEAGVVGIAAAKLTEEFHRPTILLTGKGDLLKGSCRSISGVSIFEILAHCSPILVSYGGHSMAAGVGIRSENLSKLIEQADAYIKERYADEVFLFRPHGDVPFGLKQLDEKFMDDLKLLEPFGMENARPVFYERCLALPFVRIKSHRHIKLKLKQNIEVVAFHALQNLEILNEPIEKDVYYVVEREVRGNRVGIKCYLRHIELTEIRTDPKELLFSYLATFVPHTMPTASVGIPGEKDSLYGDLKIVFSEDTFHKLCKEYPDYQKTVYRLDRSNPYNTILLAPRQKEDYALYHKITVHDAPAEQWVELLKRTYRIPIERIGEEPRFNVSVPPIDLDEMRNTYAFLKAYRNQKPFSGLPITFSELKKSGYSYDFDVFRLHWMILSELGLLRTEKGILSVLQQKVNPEHSQIIRYCRRIRQ